MPHVETNGVDTYYERHGEGQPIVFVHGLTMDRRTWRPQVDALEDTYEVITYDCRGHGKTETGNPSEYSVSLLVDDLRTLIEELDVESPVLCGHSYGGLIIAEYAHQYPDDVAGLIFADARTDVGEKVWERAFIRLQPVIHRLEDAVGEDRVERAQLAIVKRLENTEREANPEVDGLGMTVSEYEEAASDRVGRDVYTAYLQAGLDYIGTTPTAFHVPVLYVYGEQGADLIKGKAERLRRAPTDVRVREIETADHFVSLQRPGEFNTALEEFLGDVYERRQGIQGTGD
jgi:pimeloyl-ACP methyl ester carboxylesterase